jgi:iron complex transport system ATP-binding protein
VLAVDRGTFVRQGNVILDAVDWTVRPGERWTLLGANGAGKTTLLRIASTYESLTSGTTTVLSQRAGTVDVRVLRKRIALVSAFIEDVIPPRTRALDVVVMGRDARLMRWHESYDPADLAHAPASCSPSSTAPTSRTRSSACCPTVSASASSSLVP